jgi:hypothetical protein
MEVVSKMTKMTKNYDNLKYYTFYNAQSIYVHIDDIIAEGEYAVITIQKQKIGDNEREDIGQFKWALQASQLKEMTMDLLRAKGRKNHLLKIDYHFEEIHIFEINYVYNFGFKELLIPISVDLSYVSINKKGTKPYSIIHGMRSFCSFSTLNRAIFVRDCLEKLGYPEELSAEGVGKNKTLYLQICELANSEDEWLSQLTKNKIYTPPENNDEQNELVDLGYEELTFEEIIEDTVDEKLATCENKLDEVVTILKELRENGI